MAKGTGFCERCGTATHSMEARYCRPCREIRRSETMAETNRKHASARMKARNPMRTQAARERMRRTLKAIGHRPPFRGGNGRGETRPQALLSQALGWPTEVIVPTRMPRGSGYPTHYKLDVANPDEMVAVEVDGGSHCSRERRAQDRRKDEFLRALGWTVLRFWNRDVMADLGGCVRTVTSTTSKSSARTPISPMAS